MSNPTPEAPAARRRPVQQRSQERLDRILAVAEQLIAEKGSDQMTMSEIAQLAEVSIGSLYQYFPDKRAIVRTLAQAYAAESRRCIEAAMAPVADLPGLLAAFAGLVDQYHAILLARPAMRDISSGMRADKALQALELAESRACGAIVAAAMLRAMPAADKRRVNLVALLVWQLGEDAMRLALSHTRKEGSLLVDTYKRMALRALAEP